MKILKYTIVVLLSALLLAGCAGLVPEVYTGYVDERGNLSKVAVVKSATAGIYEINGNKIKHPDSEKYYSEVYLSPGEHTIRIYRWFGVSVLIVRKGYIEVISKPFSVNLEAGHVYELHGDRTTGNIRVILWIEDSTTGKIIAKEADPELLR